MLDYTGPGRHALREQFADYDLIITTYGTLRTDIAELAQIEFDYVILDEAQAIKNAESQAAKAARLLRGRHRLAMSGTPIENHLGELWSIFEFLNPGMLGTDTGLQEARRRQRRRSRTRTASCWPRRCGRSSSAGPRRRSSRTCPRRPSRPSTATWSRPSASSTRSCGRTTATALLRKDAAELNRSKIEVLEALLRLRQAACHPGLIDPSCAAEPSAKLDMLLPQIAEVVEEGHKVLVFSQFTSFLAIVRERLDQEKITYEYLDGRTRNRAERVERFQTDPDCPIFLISLKAGGLGLNLTAAEYVYLLDPWWNPAVEAQAIDRSHRIGQTQHVFAYRLICRDTVEEKILELQQKKARPGRRHPQRRQPPDPEPHPRGPRVPAVVRRATCLRPDEVESRPSCIEIVSRTSRLGKRDNPQPAFLRNGEVTFPIKCCLDIDVRDGRVIANDLLAGPAFGQQFEEKLHGDSGSFDDGFAGQDGRIHNDMILPGHGGVPCLELFISLRYNSFKATNRPL